MKNSTENPTINLNALTGETREIAARIVNTRTGRLLASKPKIEYREYMENGRRLREPTSPTGEAAYTWRMVAFQIGTRAADHCMPCTADFDLPIRDYTARRELAKHLDIIVDEIVNTVPKTEWHGINRWGNVFGLTGQPQITTDGAIIYR